MAFVPLHPVGSPRERFLDSAEIQQHAEAMEQRLSTLRERREVVRAGWGEKYVERTHAKGKMTAWERVEALKDPGAPVQVARPGRAPGARPHHRQDAWAPSYRPPTLVGFKSRRQPRE